jgi:hypothetical protein
VSVEGEGLGFEVVGGEGGATDGSPGVEGCALAQAMARARARDKETF